ncbi:TolC family protein [Desulfobacula sp.]|uniref:TolC family protein n=1 Tax=Desulfobacula sp. TaxID=2593537 RepID=UPI002606FEDF|nr:TolC family protein [Desulfobacula sp.]
MELTLHEAVTLALKNNSDVRINTLELDIKKSEIKRKLAEYIPVLNLDTSTTNFEDDPDTSELKTKNQNYQARIIQKIPLGGELSLFVNYGRSDYSAYQTDVTNFRLGPDFSVESFSDTLAVASKDNYYTELNLFYRQHLLKDGILGPAFIPIKETGFNHDIQKERLNQSRIILIRLVETSFYQTTLRQREIKIYQEILEINKQLLKDIESKQKLGMIPEIDVMSARIKVNEAITQVISSKISFEHSVQKLKTLLNIEDRIKVIDQFSSSHNFLGDLDKLLSLAMAMNKEVAQLKTSLKKEELLVAVAKNQYLPQVDLYVNINKKDQGTSFGNANDLEETEYKAGIVFTYPFYPTDPKEKYFQAKKTLDKIKIQLREAELRISNQVNMFYNQIQLVEKKISAQSRQIKILKDRMDLALKAFKERLIDLKIVYDIQDDRISGEQKYLYYLFEYQSLNSSLQELTGQKLSFYNL